MLTVKQYYSLIVMLEFAFSDDHVRNSYCIPNAHLILKRPSR